MLHLNFIANNELEQRFVDTIDSIDYDYIYRLGQSALRTLVEQLMDNAVVQEMLANPQYLLVVWGLYRLYPLYEALVRFLKRITQMGDDY